jgi:hypothetical protein
MMAINCMCFQDGLTSPAGGNWALDTASPLRAFENVLGMQAPVGFWDPVGIVVDGSTEDTAHHRQTEIKHGRIAVLAAMGHIMSKVPSAVWCRVLACMAFCETSQDQSPGIAASKGDLGFKGPTSSDPAAKTAKLSPRRPSSAAWPGWRVSACSSKGPGWPRRMWQHRESARRRHTEIKHGRIAVPAAMSYLSSTSATRGAWWSRRTRTSAT